MRNATKIWLANLLLPHFLIWLRMPYCWLLYTPYMQIWFYSFDKQIKQSHENNI
jgi:hypothetical protein